MKKSLTVIALSSILLGGCASYQAPQTQSASVNLSENAIRNKIVAAANRGQWDVCENEDKTLRLNKFFKKYYVALLAKYDDSGYTLSVYEPLTTLKNAEGKVHPKVNKILTKTNTLIQRTNASLEDTFVVEKCTNLTNNRNFKGSMFTGYRTQSNIVWVGDIQRLPKDATFNVKVLKDGEIPEVLVDSMYTRTTKALKARGKFVEQGSHAIEISLKNFNQTTNGAATDFITTQGKQELKAVASIKDSSGSKICDVNISTMVPIGGWGIISRSSNKITATINEALMTHLTEDILEK